MQRPRLIEEFRGRVRRENLVIQNDRIAELPDAKPEKQTERERVELRRGKGFHHRVRAAVSKGRPRARGLPARCCEAAAGFVPARTNYPAPVSRKCGGPPRPRRQSAADAAAFRRPPACAATRRAATIAAAAAPRRAGDDIPP